MAAGDGTIARNESISNEKIAALGREHDTALEELKYQLTAAQADVQVLRDQRGYVSRAYFDREVEAYRVMVADLDQVTKQLPTLFTEMTRHQFIGLTEDEFPIFEQVWGDLNPAVELAKAITPLRSRPVDELLFADQDVQDRLHLALDELFAATQVIDPTKAPQECLEVFEAACRRAGESRDQLLKSIRAQLQDLKVRE